MNSRILILVSYLICHLSAIGGEMILQWNEAALDAIRTANTSPPAATRHLAILHASIYDAVNGILRTSTPYLVTGEVPSSASIEAAAATAAHDVMSILYPALALDFDALYRRSLEDVRDGPQKDDGIAWGRHVAATLLQRRSNDGSSNVVSYSPGTEPGQWRPTVSFGEIVRPALLPHWGFVEPFAIPSASQFRPPPPPALNTRQYSAEFNMVKAIGGRISAVRTEEQKEIALFWSYGPGTATPPGHWNQIAQVVAARAGNTIEQNARLFALLNIAMADAAIISWECKYIYNFWRPITAIHESAADGNPETSPDSGWMPLLATPPFPEYTSGHSTFSGAAAAVLARFFRSDYLPFRVGSDDLPGISRRYQRFSEAAYESGVSRIYGGIHFMSANLHGLSTGAAVGNYVFSNALLPKDHRARDKR